jgi:predicted AAA+ superfamily ATPase
VNGRFILTGSQVFNLMAGLSESLAGRACLFELLPFSFEELSASGLLPLPRSFADCCRRMIRGFYPVPNIENTDSNAFYGAYLPLYIERDLRQIRNIGDITSFERFLRILAARAGNLLNITNLARDCDISHATAKNWLSMLENSRIIYLLKPYYANIAKRLIKSPKVYFTDTGLLLYLMKYPDAETLMASPAAGAVFENMIVVEFLKKKINHCSTEDLFFYRDSNGVEIDLVIDRGPFRELHEIKATKTPRPDMILSLSRVEIGAVKKSLLSLYENTLPLGSGITALPWWVALNGQPS